VPLRVLHTPTNTGNHPQGIARAERELGLDSRCVQLWGAWFDYEVDELLARPGDGRLAVERRRWRLLQRALFDFDVIHFNFGSSLLPTAAPASAHSALAKRIVDGSGKLYARVFGLRDLPLLHRAGKTIVVTYQGDDARQGRGKGVPAFHQRLAETVGSGYYTELDDERKRRSISAFERHAARIYYLNPDLGAFLPERAEFMPYGHADPRSWPTPGLAARDRPPVVIHAPSHRGIKGTRFVVEAIERLQREGVELDFRLVEGLPHDEARRAYEHADVLVDQLLVGWYGGLAVEFMALGKPVVCFVADRFAERYAPPEMMRELPIVRATRDDVHEVLGGLLTRPRGELAELGLRGRAFVERWHDPLALAARLRDAYEAQR
jgi:glycosyltransferase involved in cell wall biosynthesis